MIYHPMLAVIVDFALVSIPLITCSTQFDILESMCAMIRLHTPFLYIFYDYVHSSNGTNKVVTLVD